MQARLPRRALQITRGTKHRPAYSRRKEAGTGSHEERLGRMAHATGSRDMSKALTKHDLPQIVQRYAAGESVRTLAAELKVGRGTLYNWMLAGVGDERYESIVTQVLVRRVAEADEALEDAKEAHEVSKARERARFARMDLERRRPHLYGQRSSVTIDDQRVPVEHTIGDDLASLLDAVRTVSTMPSLHESPERVTE